MLTSHFGRVDPTWKRIARRSWALENLPGCKPAHADTRTTHKPTHWDAPCIREVAPITREGERDA